jgi:NAD(P)-dependent dehydrogenase (short-subunit alcohol dehydrogenase family)
LRNKVYLVTGATSGIGKGICYELLKEGYIVLGLGRNELKINDLLAEFDTLFRFISFDLNDIEAFESVIGELIKGIGKLDGIVLCAGREETIPLLVYTPKKISSLFQVNVTSNIEILRVFSKKKYSNDMASAVLVSSVMGELGQPGKVGYCATKAAILGVVRAASLELAKRRIRVNAISPGVVKTPMTINLFDQLTDDQVESITKMHPLGLGELEDIIPTIKFLLSDGSKWITGQNIIIDGGYSVQ